MNDIESRAREYLAEHSEYSEVFGQTFVAVDTLTAMVEFSKQETKEWKEQIEKVKYALRKIIKTVQNDRIDEYGARLVIIYDISCEILQELEKMSEQHKANFIQIKPIINQRSVQNNKLSKAKELLQKCLNTYLRDPELRSEVEEFLKEGK